MSTFLFYAKLFFNFLESSKTHFDIVATKIGVKLNNLVIYGDILVNFLRILITKLTISQKNKNCKIIFSFFQIAKLFSFFQNIAHLFGPKT